MGMGRDSVRVAWSLETIKHKGRIMILLLLTSLNLLANEDCINIKINQSGTGFMIPAVNFTLQDPKKKYCLKLPQVTYAPPQNFFVEFQTTNKHNTSCGTLSLKAIRPNKPDVTGSMSNTKCATEVPSPQPACILNYTVGKWVIKYELGKPCQPGNDRWDLIGRWSLK